MGDGIGSCDVQVFSRGSWASLKFRTHPGGITHVDFKRRHVIGEVRGAWLWPGIAGHEHHDGRQALGIDGHPRRVPIVPYAVPAVVSGAFQP